MRNLVVRFRLRAQKGRSFFDIVVAQSPQRHRGAFIAHLGYLNLTSTEKSFYIDVPRLAYWLNLGAKMNPNVQKWLAKLA